MNKSGGSYDARSELAGIKAKTGLDAQKIGDDLLIKEIFSGNDASKYDIANAASALAGGGSQATARGTIGGIRAAGSQMYKKWVEMRYDSRLTPIYNVLSNAYKKGADNFALTHSILLKKDPEYRKYMEEE